MKFLHLGTKVHCRPQVIDEFFLSKQHLETNLRNISTTVIKIQTTKAVKTAASHSGAVTFIQRSVLQSVVRKYTLNLSNLLEKSLSRSSSIIECKIKLQQLTTHSWSHPTHPSWQPTETATPFDSKQVLDTMATDGDMLTSMFCKGPQNRGLIGMLRNSGS